MKMRIVTSFGAGGWEAYAREFVYSWVLFWPLDVELWVYYHDTPLPEDAPTALNVRYIKLNDVSPEMLAFKEKYPQANGVEGQTYNFRKDALKFCHKVFAVAHGVKESIDKVDYVIWLDGDVATQGPVTKSDLLAVMPKEKEALSYLGRIGTYTESSFVGINMKSEDALDFIADLRDNYTSGNLFNFAEWHDGFIIQYMIDDYSHKGGVKFKNLTPGVVGITNGKLNAVNALNASPMGKKLIHFKGGAKKGGPQPIRIIPRNSVEEKCILDNIEYNITTIKKWISKCVKHNGIAVCVSAGPSLETEMVKLKKLLVRHGDKAKVFCVKHALPILLKNGITPYAVVMLDARDVDGVSTHNIKRRDLLEILPKETIFLIASMTHTSTTNYLLEKGANVVGWHAFSDTARKWGKWHGELMIFGGTCSALRLISLSKVIGFRRFECFGFDFSLVAKPEGYGTEKDGLGRPKFLHVSGTEDAKKKWYSTGELMAGVQDIRALAGMEQVDVDEKYSFHGDSLGNDVWKRWRPERHTSFRNLDKYMRE